MSSSQVKHKSNMQLTYQYTWPYVRQSDGDGARPEPDASSHSPLERGAPRTSEPARVSDRG
eukprot:708900-Pleurochrysis_carterae.AAC.1